jgi:predicted transcriptional regulator
MAILNIYELETTVLNLKQERLAQRASVSRRVVLDLERGKGCGLSSLIEILRALRKLDQLDRF